MALPGEPCKIEPVDEWTDIEKWVWIEICEGYAANLDKRSGNTKFDPKNPNHGDELLAKRQLSARFLKTILLYEPFRSAVPHQGVQIVGAYFEEKIDLNDASIERPLELKNSLFKSPVIMRRLATTKAVSFIGSAFKGELDIDSASIDGHLFMSNAQFKEVTLSAIRISGGLMVDGSSFNGEMHMHAASVGKDLFMQYTEFGESVNLMFLKVGLNLDLRDATLKKIDLTGAHIAEELWIGSLRIKKVRSRGVAPRMVLRNTSISALQDMEGAWPANLRLEIEGFTYQRLGGFTTSENDTHYERSSEWFINWLSKDKTYSPQPYLQLARVLRSAGHDDKADEILYQNREEQRKFSETSWVRWLLLSGLKVTIGYGYGWRYFGALGWVAFFVVLGGIILPIRDERLNEEKLGFWYSIDMLLPVIRLREKHYEVDLKNRWIQRYFYVHKIIGYLLIFFVIAGLAGLAEWGQQSPSSSNMLSP